jgi:hypothetical protein
MRNIILAFIAILLSIGFSHSQAWHPIDTIKQTYRYSDWRRFTPKGEKPFYYQKRIGRKTGFVQYRCRKRPPYSLTH